MTRSQINNLPLQLHKSLLPLTLLSLTACSTLRVDVDVYKGPLVNERQVQKSQLAGMVLGAKPLLHQVDMSLRHDGFKHEKMPEMEITAGFVEEILSLYENNQDVKKVLGKLKDEKNPLITTTIIKEVLTKLIELSSENSSTHQSAQLAKLRMARILRDDKYVESVLKAKCTSSQDEFAKEYCEKDGSIGHSSRSLSAIAKAFRKDKVEAITITEDTADNLKRYADGMQGNNGLEILIKQCAFKDNEEGKSDECINFIDELTVFAERVRILGNSSKFHMPIAENEAGPHVGGKSFLGNDSAQAMAAERYMLGINTYAPVLQTIGNSILSLVNELERHERMEKKIRKGLKKGEAAKFEQDLWRAAKLRIRTSLRSEFEVRPTDKWAEDKRRKEIDATLDSLQTTVISKFDEIIKEYREAIFPITSLESAAALLKSCPDDKKGSDLLNDVCLTKDKAAAKAASNLLDDTEKNTTSGVDNKSLGEKIDASLVSFTKKRDDANLLDKWKQQLLSSKEVIVDFQKATVEKPAAVMDMLLANLQRARMEAVLEYGKDSTEATRLNEAIRQATAYRATMIRLVPASAYLSNSHPATSIDQGTDQRDTHNFLMEGFRGGFPNFFSEKPKGEDAVRQELDQQYWQPVNRVHVSGGGKTNQVLAKDDVGNWYVKQYDSDKNSIFASMKNLALYNLRGKVPALQQAKMMMTKDQDLSYGGITLASLGVDGTDAKLNIPAPGTLSAAYRVTLANYAGKVLDSYKKLACLSLKDASNNEINPIADDCANGEKYSKKLAEIKTLSKLERKLLQALQALADLDNCKTDTCKAASPQIKLEASNYYKLLDGLNNDLTTLALGLTVPIQK